MSEIASRKKGVIQHEHNPFLQELEVPLKKRFSQTESGMFITAQSQQNGSGECVDVAAITRVEFVDEERFVKIYTDELRQFFSLKPSTQKVLQIVLVELQKRKDKDLVYLDYKHACAYFTDQEVNGKKIMSRPTFHSCIKEMIANNFIAESTYQNQYFINPKLFFNGSRLKLVKEYRIARKENQQELFNSQEPAA